MTSIRITQHDGGTYTIRPANGVEPIGWITRNNRGGGYTIETADGATSVGVRNLPPAANWSEFEAAIERMIEAANVS